MKTTQDLNKANVQLQVTDDTTSYAGLQNYAVYCRGYKNGKREPLFDGYYRHADLIEIN